MKACHHWMYYLLICGKEISSFKFISCRTKSTNRSRSVNFYTCSDLVRGSPDIKLAGQHALGELGDVEGEGHAEEEVEYEDTGQEDLHFVTVVSVEEDPVKGGHEAVDGEGEKVDEPEHHVLVLVHLVHEHNPGDDEASHGGQVDGAQGGMAPEGIVDTWMWI